MLKYIDFLAPEGKKSDFDQEWYNSTGKTLVESMMINSVLPIILEGVYYIMRWNFRRGDSKGTAE